MAGTAPFMKKPLPKPTMSNYAQPMPSPAPTPPQPVAVPLSGTDIAKKMQVGAGGMSATYPPPLPMPPQAQGASPTPMPVPAPTPNTDFLKQFRDAGNSPSPGVPAPQETTGGESQLGTTGMPPLNPEAVQPPSRFPWSKQYPPAQPQDVTSVWQNLQKQRGMQ
jgi:hypothetical protein